MAHHFLVYRRTWRGSIISRFLSPLFFLLSMGLGLGALVDDSAGGVDGVPYLQYVVPGILAMQAMMTAFGESTYAVMGYIKWNQMYAAMLATPLRVVEVLGGHLAVVAFHLFTGAAIFVVVAAPFGAFSSWWVVLAVPGRRAHRPRLRRAHLRPGRPPRERQRLQHPVPVRRHAADAVLRHLLPDRPAAGVDAAAGLGHPAVARRRAVPRRRHGHRARMARCWCTWRCSWLYVGVGWVLARASFTRRLVS